MFVDGARPIDWLILGTDFLVLIAILYLELPERLHRKKCSKTVIRLSELLNEGRGLINEVPSRGSHNEHMLQMQGWRKRADSWAVSTKTFLEGRSKRAADAFVLIVSVAEVGSQTMVHKSGGETVVLTGNHSHLYQAHLERLRNLQGIIEKSEAYF